MMRTQIIVTLALAGLAACGPDIPALDARLDAGARAADYPELVPLGPLLAGVDAVPVRTAAAEGQSLEARAANLRARAARLRAIPL